MRSKEISEFIKSRDEQESKECTIENTIDEVRKIINNLWQIALAEKSV